MASTIRRIKVTLTNNHSEIIEMNHPISAEAWLAATKRDGPRFVTLNGTSYPKEDLVDATEVKARTGRTDMEGI
jgi:hypothetical protein